MRLFSRSKHPDANFSENDLYTRGTTARATQWFYSSVSCARLWKTGILQWLSGDCQPIPEGDGSISASVDTQHIQKARHERSFLSLKKEILRNPDCRTYLNDQVRRYPARRSFSIEHTDRFRISRTEALQWRDEYPDVKTLQIMMPPRFGRGLQPPQQFGESDDPRRILRQA